MDHLSSRFEGGFDCQRDSTQPWGSRTKVIDHKANPYDSVGSRSLGNS